MVDAYNVPSNDYKHVIFNVSREGQIRKKITTSKEYKTIDYVDLIFFSTLNNKLHCYWVNLWTKLNANS